ncbi:hypothetical protein M378DRAFT_790623 [Amanita muscaria Koide BX008]|uniref:mRNA decay factor PAT1 domain-containing protein n=1 Tax=Amanita muscaria (strain Koide BX008) TaxID=946122 RepID=A0A0C2XK92_AMAMK|nr:hypothetical protein M378DRAFT_790623 [Amanita muscaria Koide BX008]
MFFGFEQKDLEKGKQAFRTDATHDTEEVPVFTWGDESYDGLGDALQEGGDELNDETFGSVGLVGKDFDFSNTTLPKSSGLPNEQALPPQKFAEPASSDTLYALRRKQDFTTLDSDQPFSSSSQSAESIWDNRSLLSSLPQLDGIFNQSKQAFAEAPVSELPMPQTQKWAPQSSNSGIRTLEEIEAEMRAAAHQSRVQQRELSLQQQLQQEEDRRQQTLHEQELQRQILHQQEQQHQLYLQRLLQQREQQYQRSTPPRMLPASQSPRFLEQQRQLLLLQQQQRAQELQEQLMLEEMERQLLARAALQQQHRQSPIPPSHHRPPSLTPDVYGYQRRQTRSQSPMNNDHRYPGIPQESSPFPSPQNIQLQQRLLSEMAQAEFIRNIQNQDGQGINPVEQEALRAEAMRKILEAEKMEEKRRRKAAKIAYMSRYNDLMTQSDKDFITRIQVSQLVTQDPYADDFYAQVYGAILRSRMGLQSQDERVLIFGSGGGVGLGLNGPKGGGRRPSAMQRMEQQVERIVNNTRKREEEKGVHALQSLQGALGKTSGRSYKAAPRQLLQVDPASGASPAISQAQAFKDPGDRVSNGAEEAAKLGRATLGKAADTTNLIRREPLTQRETLTILEHLYDLVLHVEQLRRDHSLAQDEQQTVEWQQQYDTLVDEIWDSLRVMVPLETSDPHPFISLLIPGKGKRLLPRITRHLSDQKMMTLLTLLVACFSQLDVIKQASVIDYSQDTLERAEAERQTQAFLGNAFQCILPVVAKASLRLVTGLLGLLLDRSNIIMVAQTRPGLALLTLFLSRVELIKADMVNVPEEFEVPTPEEAQQWQLVYDHFFQLLGPHFPMLFPSARMATATDGQVSFDIIDQPAWHFFAALGLHAVPEQQHVLITALREKILDNVTSANKGWVRNDEERQLKLDNVNLLLHVLNLDSSLIVL